MGSCAWLLRREALRELQVVFEAEAEARVLRRPGCAVFVTAGGFWAALITVDVIMSVNGSSIR